MLVPPYPEYMPFMDSLALALYVFLSREQVERLDKLGPLAAFLSNTIAHDLSEKRSDLYQRRFRDDELARSQASTGYGPVSSIVTSAAPTESAGAAAHGQTDEAGVAVRRRPFQQPGSKEFFRLAKANDVLKCLQMLKVDAELAEDCDEERRTALHWACALDLADLAQVLVDYGARLNAKDDHSRRPMDEAQAYALAKKKPLNATIKELHDQANEGTLRRDRTKYEHPLYVKYLTPLEQVKELQDFIEKVNDMSTLTQKQRDAKAAEQAREEEARNQSKMSSFFGDIEAKYYAADRPPRQEDEVDVDRQVRNLPNRSRGHSQERP